MKTFEKAKEASACEGGYKMGLEAQSKSDLLKAITANWFWVFRNTKIVDAAFLEENFTEEELTEAGIYTRREHRVSTVAFACGSATVKAYDSATVEACGSATVEAYDSATVEACGSATVEAYGSATVEACGNSYVEDCHGGIMPQSDFAIVKDYYAHKIYVKKGMFEIIEVE